MNNRQIGSFESNSGQFVVSDPSYELELSEKGRKFQVIITDVAKGQWSTTVSYNNSKEIVSLEVQHESLQPNMNLNWEKCDFRGAIDSAMVGVFDKDYFRNDGSITQVPTEVYGNDIWYSSCCENIKNELSAGIMPGGIIISINNDGEYETFVSKSSNDQIVAVKITL